MLNLELYVYFLTVLNRNQFFNTEAKRKYATHNPDPDLSVQMPAKSIHQKSSNTFETKTGDLVRTFITTASANS